MNKIVKLGQIFKIVIGIILSLLLSVILADLLILRFFDLKLRPDLFVGFAFFAFVLVFVYIVISSISTKAKLFLIGCEMVLIIISVTISEKSVYRYATYNEKEIIEVCSSVTAIGQSCSYYYPIENEVFMSTKAVATANYGVVMGNANTIFLKEPIEIK